MNPQLPEFNINGDLFIVDLLKGELRDRENHSNNIPFRDMKLTQNGFEFLYDAIIRNVFNGTLIERNQRPDVFMVRLPPRKELDPELWAKVFEPPGPYIEFKLDEIKPIDKIMQRELPVVDLCGTKFFVDLEIGALREVDNPFNTIGFYDLAKNDNGYVVIYDPQVRNTFFGSDEELMERQDLKTLQLPTIQEMDPVGFIEMCRNESKQMRLRR